MTADILAVKSGKSVTIQFLLLPRIEELKAHCRGLQ